MFDPTTAPKSEFDRLLDEPHLVHDANGNIRPVPRIIYEGAGPDGADLVVHGIAESAGTATRTAKAEAEIIDIGVFRNESRFHEAKAEQSKPEPPKPKTYRHTLIDPDLVSVVASTRFLIEGLIPSKEISVICGPAKMFKTFLVLSWLLCVATGRDWFGRKVRRAKVLYFIGEGGDAFMGRINAWAKFNGVTDLERYFKVDRRMVSLFDKGDLTKTIGEIDDQGFRPEVIAIDTLGRAMGAAKETTEDFNKIFAHLDALQEYWSGLTLLLVHHNRKSDLTFRGPQVIAADSDNLIYMERVGKELKANITCEFSRNASEFDPLGITLARQDVLTEDGLQGFLVVNGVCDPFAVPRKGERLNPKDGEGVAYGILKARGFTVWTTWTEWFEAVKAARGGKLGTSTMTRYIDKLQERKLIRTNADGLYQAVDPLDLPSGSIS